MLSYEYSGLNQSITILNIIHFKGDESVSGGGGIWGMGWYEGGI